jgi:acyl carrier protein
MDTLTVVRDFLRDRIEIAPERIIPEAVLADLGIDSLILLELMFECEERLDIKFADDVDPPKTIGELLAIVSRLQPVTSAG